MSRGAVVSLKSTPTASCADCPEYPGQRSPYFVPSRIHHRGRGLRIAAYIGALLGVALLITLVVRADFAAMLQTFEVGGWRLLWLIPYRALYYLLYAIGWLNILRPYNPGRRAGLGYLFWVTSVRDAIDRLLPVASVGGSLAGVRLLRWRGLAAVPVGASVIVEILLTLVAVIFPVQLLPCFTTSEPESRVSVKSAGPITVCVRGIASLG